MLRPERMSKVSITGTKSVMAEVIEAIHDLNLVHLSDYDGTWTGFDNGRPIGRAEEASERLVTIRSLERTLDLESDVPPSSRPLSEDQIDTRLEEAREAITSLEDELAETREARREIDDQIEQLEPFATLGIELDLLSGYDSLETSVGTGNAARIESALSESDDIDTFEIFAEDDVVAIFAVPADGASNSIQDALVGLEFSAMDVPDIGGDPTDTIRQLESEQARLESEVRSLEADMESLAHEYGDFLQTAEFQLSVEVDRAEAPLRFATTDHAFVAEGWIPASEFDDLVAALDAAIGDRVEVERLRTAAYGEHEHGAEAHEGEPEVATDGGAVTMDDEPPVVMDNPAIASPFELLTELVNRPKYGEIDPTLAVFLTFPLAFGFMIGDIGYGVLYMLMGWFLLQYESRGFQLVGMIAVWCGGFTVLFGWLFDDTFGVHLLDYDIAAFQAMELIGLGVLSKGIQSPDWLMTWILASLFFGWLHLNIGLVIRFVNELAHGWKAAIYEGGSWILAMNGFLLWLFSHQDAGTFGLIETDMTAAAGKPAEFFGAESVIAHTGFHGFPEIVGVFGLLALVGGLVLVGIGEGIAGLAESPAWVLGHFLSYLRIVAVLLGKGAMAFVVNLIVFGAYISEADYVLFNLPGGTPEAAAGAGVGIEEVAFAGLWNMEPGILLIPIAILVFIVGHIIVLLLGITAAGIQMLRLEYVEFFQKFFEGGGRKFVPFGRERSPAGD